MGTLARESPKIYLSKSHLLRYGVGTRSVRRIRLADNISWALKECTFTVSLILKNYASGYSSQ